MKGKDLLLKHLDLNDCKGVIPSDGMLYRAVINALEEAINYTPCCETLPVNREIALKFRENLINEHYKNDPNKSTFGLAFITCYDWLAKLCTK